MTIPTRLRQRDLRGPVDGEMLARASHLGGMRPRTPAGGAITEDLCEVEEDACLRELKRTHA